MSRTGRPDFDAMVKISSVPSDEPIFLLRAQDPNAAPAVRAWAAIARAQGVPSAVIEQALRQADAMDKWRPKKRPSADHLSDGDRRRLEYEHDRRAWVPRRATAPPRHRATAPPRTPSPATRRPAWPRASPWPTWCGRSATFSRKTSASTTATRFGNSSSRCARIWRPGREADLDDARKDRSCSLNAAAPMTRPS